MQLLIVTILTSQGKQPLSLFSCLYAPENGTFIIYTHFKAHYLWQSMVSLIYTWNETTVADEHPYF